MGLQAYMKRAALWPCGWQQQPKKDTAAMIYERNIPYGMAYLWERKKNAQKYSVVRCSRYTTINFVSICECAVLTHTHSVCFQLGATSGEKAFQWERKNGVCNIHARKNGIHKFAKCEWWCWASFFFSLFLQTSGYLEAEGKKHREIVRSHAMGTSDEVALLAVCNFAHA